jgi:hypothetical protein
MKVKPERVITGSDLLGRLLRGIARVEKQPGGAARDDAAARSAPAA